MSLEVNQYRLMKIIFGAFSATIVAAKNCNITPYTLLELAFNANLEPMVLSSPIWDSWAEVPC
jgi:hypothetical protein